MVTTERERPSPSGARLVASILVTIGACLYGVAVPILEVNDTHVFDPAWPPHARLHEVWQLFTNSAIAVWSLWWVWRRRELGLPIALGAVVTGGFLAAYAIRASYGGSMQLSSGVEHTVAGLNIGVVGFGAVNVMSLAALVAIRSRARPRRKVP
ncbi:MAG: hypothetical protein JST00_35630 [Deltaproteobacteria bacterium]|nr:hypothetical protein [Deltaproteobacteria bacterium]